MASRSSKPRLSRATLDSSAADLLLSPSSMILRSMSKKSTTRTRHSPSIIRSCSFHSSTGLGMVSAEKWFAMSSHKSTRGMDLKVGSGPHPNVLHASKNCKLGGRCVVITPVSSQVGVVLEHVQCCNRRRTASDPDNHEWEEESIESHPGLMLTRRETDLDDDQPCCETMPWQSYTTTALDGGTQSPAHIIVPACQIDMILSRKQISSVAIIAVFSIFDTDTQATIALYPRAGY
ncbi:hypothetical protein C8Q74DRAFT_777594 [Fomes fomentarius]|nr:hypothetical protein C8Q74DRAFT_777594 [Fomes fomentarius]